MSHQEHNAALSSHHEENHVHDHTKYYIATIAALFVLTAITVGAAQIHFGSNFVNLMIAMAIATVKATLVALFFMHLRWEKGMNAIVFLSSIFFVGVFMVFTFLDIESRVTIEAATAEDGSVAGVAPQDMPLYVKAPAQAGEGEAHANGAGAETKAEGEAKPEGEAKH